MTVKYFRCLVTLIFLAVSISATAKDCLVVPALSVCGLPLSTTITNFENAFGQPDGRINMGTNRLGLLYGSNFMVIFRDGKIWEIHNWEDHSGSEWFGYVGFGRKDRITLVQFPKWNPWNWQAWSSSADRKQLNKTYPEVDGDPESDIRKIKGGSVFVLYRMLESVRGSERNGVSSIKINFDGEPVSP